MVANQQGTILVCYNTIQVMKLLALLSNEGELSGL